MIKRQTQIKTQAFLANLPMFSEMGSAELDRLAAGTVPLHFDKGQPIFQCGDPCTGFHVVVYGQVKLAFTSPQGGEKVLEIIRPGQSFGEGLMFLDKPYLVYGEALADTLLLHVAKHAVLEELGPNPFGRRMMAGLAMRLHGLVRDVEAYTLRSGQERVIGYLLGELPESAEGPGEVRLTPGKSVLASRLNMTPEHFSRILHDLAAEGLIEVNGRAIQVRDIHRLRSARAVPG